MEDGVGILVADDQDVQGQIAVEFLHPGQGDVVDQILLEAETLEQFGIVLD